ncbi:MAG: AAA family ATPase [Cyanothece sp. SIO1E1]|nr:AAA family ATPase [Cyanothece sp. SIO1E1]
MAVNLRNFYSACNPSKTLKIENPEDRRYYIDFCSVRGSNIVRELERTITQLLPDEATCQLFTGHIGCGKSTELLWLKANLEQQGFHVVYFESSEYLDMADVDITDILLAIAHQVSLSLKHIGIHLGSDYFTYLFQEIAAILNTQINISGLDFAASIAKVTARAKASPSLRNQLRQYLEPRTNGILEAINGELLHPAARALKQRGQQGLVVIVDNLDRVDNSVKVSERTQPEYLFVDRGEQLKQLNCHVVYTLPLALMFSNELNSLTNRFGVDPKILPMVRVRSRHGEDCELGITLLHQMVLARAFPDITPDLRVQLVTKIFDQVETLDRLCRVSGGHVRNLLVLLYRCLQREDLPISRRCLESVIKQRQNELLLAVTHDEWSLLNQVAQQKNLRGEKRYQTLLRSMFVFEYCNADDCWFDINPILAEAKEL